ncbi:DUF3180 domain-containing protein [Zafaria sp. Z1313]|uniref:DUF3180 domain-containing protein n=1 Tax=unclassified Zafaria TaxID=2828765 RepID=UPI002E7A299C|nr:DUF3180 domain-containing protein [Zafaria sp. J156]MEE1621401.1 DUF3180 domain-containing protein [Zafaria sp. J156]
MQAIRPLWLLAIVLGSVIAGWAGHLLTSSNGLAAPVLHWTSLITMGAGSLITLGFGLRVRRHQQALRERREHGTGAPKARSVKPLNPLVAARTLVLAQATAYAGAMILGWHAGILIDLMGAVRAGSPAVVSSFVMMAGAAVMIIVGWLVEQFCRLPPDGPAPGAERDSREDNEGYATGTS